MTLPEHGRDSAPVVPVPAYAQPRLVLLVLIGGALGSGAREGIALLMPAGDGVPWAVLLVNVMGALLLGLLLGSLASRGAETRAQRAVRLFAGTGILGGFTTYSTFAVGIVTLSAHDPLAAAAYAVGSVVAGLLAAALGLRVGSARRSRPDEGSADE